MRENEKRCVLSLCLICIVALCAFAEESGRPSEMTLQQRQSRPLRPVREPVSAQDERPPRQRDVEGAIDTPPDPLGPPARPNRIRLLRSLGLSRDQMVRSRRLHVRMGPTLQQLADELEDSRDAFNDAIFQDPYNAEIVEQRVRQVMDKQEQLMRAQVEIELGFRNILTPEQLQKFRKLQSDQFEIRRLQREIRQKQRQLNQDIQEEQR